ncbi:MAG: hypothetical protein Q4D87_07015 [Actinomycetaceae bacterium]|nr:hypothetical protein [Actinomycetaceae bacterium]
MSVELNLPDKSCQLMIAGHQMHWIQAKICLRHPAIPVEIIDVDGNYITFANEDQVWTYWHHSKSALQNLLEFMEDHPDSFAKFHDEGTALRAGVKGNWRYFSLSKEPHDECSMNPLHPDGFGVPVTAVNDPAVQKLFDQVVERARERAKQNKQADE